MAYKISDLTGTVVSPSGTYPFGDVKDAPSGTVVDKKMVTDMLQFFQKMASQTGVTLNSTPDNVTNGYQLMQSVTSAINSYAATWVLNTLGANYDNTKTYVIYGCETATSNGYVFYNGKIYYCTGRSGPSCGGGLVDILQMTSPMSYTSGLQTLNIVCGTSGTGIADYSAVVYLNSWTDFTPVFGSGAGGSFTVDLADVKSARYRIDGKTCFVQVRAENITVTSAPSYISITLPFLAANAFKNPTQYDSYAFYLAPSGATKQTMYQQTINGTTPSVRGYASTGFVAGTNDSNVYFNLVFEIV
jgi:hypothetical protein